MKKRWFKRLHRAILWTDRQMWIIWLGIGIWSAIDGNGWVALIAGWACRSRLNEAFKSMP